MSKPTLLVMAAGLGSRFGGIKQMSPVGEAGEFIIDYSVYDAWRAGFGKVVFIVRDELLAPMKEHFGSHLDGRIECEYVIQSLQTLPEGFACPATRAKPWGTGHAVWCARNAIQGNFAIVNGDDFYGKQSFAAMAEYLNSADCGPRDYGMVAFRLNNTLSENGTVSRGICTVDAQGLLTDVVERTAIEAQPGGAARFQEADGSWSPLTGQEPASMNLWGFNDSLFGQLDIQLKEFLQANIDEPKKEFFVPTVVHNLIGQGWRVHVRHSTERWFGLTYTEDRQIVLDELRRLTESGVYPHGLWR